MCTKHYMLHKTCHMQKEKNLRGKNKHASLHFMLNFPLTILFLFVSVKAFFRIIVVLVKDDYFKDYVLNM